MCLFDVHLLHRNVFVAPLVGDHYLCLVCGILQWFDAHFWAGTTNFWVLREACCGDQQSERWDTWTLTKASIRSEGCFITGLVVHWQLMINCTIGLQVHILDCWWAVTELYLFTMLNVIWISILLALAGVTLAFTEPPEARKPTTRWRLYVFKDGEPLNGEICSTTVFDLLLLSGKMSPSSMTSVWLRLYA